MQVIGEPKAFIRSEAADFMNLYASLGERAESFLPKHILDNLRNFVRLCYEEPVDPVKQQAEINRYILEFKEDIPGYADVSLMLFPHKDSKAFQYSYKKLQFNKRLTSFIDTESVDETTKQYARNIINTHDYSIGTPPVTREHIDFMAKILLGDEVRDLRKFRDVIGVVGDTDEAHWNFLMDTLDQMVNQSSHYTTKPEKSDFLHRTEWAVNFKGLNGLIRTVVSGNADTAIDLLAGEVFSKESVRVLDNPKSHDLLEMMKQDSMSIFVVKVKNVRKSSFVSRKWFPMLCRLVFVDDSPESKSSNTSLVFAFHNDIINTLNKVHTKKLGAPANSQLNVRLIIEYVNDKYLKEFKEKLNAQITEYENELEQLKKEQVGETGNFEKNLILFKYDDFTRQILKDKYAIEKLRDYIVFIQNLKDETRRQEQNRVLIDEFEKRTLKYFYSENPQVKIACIVEGGGRNQIKTYGDYLLNKKKLNDVSDTIIERCKTILDIIPDCFERTLKNHFHKNFGINLFLEKYQEYLSKVNNEATNTGRFHNLLIDLGIYDKYKKLDEKQQAVIKDFISRLSNFEKTSIADDVQMIIRDLLFLKAENGNLNAQKPYIVYNQGLSWEYKDLFPEDRFGINPFDIEIENSPDGRIDYDRLLYKLNRIKNTLALFDETGTLWDKFCENTTILINDPSNPTGFSDFNKEALIRFLKFLNKSKITLFLDEAYSDSVKVEYHELPKWRTISRYVFNNISTYSTISVVTSLSTTKNLGATGDRLGSLVATDKAKGVIQYAKQLNHPQKGNSNSLFMLNNILETAQTAKKIKDKMEAQLPKNASRQKIKEYISHFIKQQITQKNENNRSTQSKGGPEKFAGFEGSPIHVFLLDELKALDKLDVLELPDDFKYRGEPFFVYYNKYLVGRLNSFRVNKNFRRESNKRLSHAKEIARKVVTEGNHETVNVVDSDGSYLFNLQLKHFSSYIDLVEFTTKLAEQRGIAAIPYKTGNIRFSLGGYIQGSRYSYDIARKEFENALQIFLKYWKVFFSERSKPENKEIKTDDILRTIFRTGSEREFLDAVLFDFEPTKGIKRIKNESLKINDIRTLYHADPKESGICINTIGNSSNTVIEFSGNISSCRDITLFIRSRAFTKIYENLLAQVYKNIPQLKYLNFNTVASRYSKATLLKYIHNKKEYYPNHYVLDDPDELNIMREILIEMEKVLFSDSKMKILALPASQSIYDDQARLEGVNSILKKHISEILLHFNLPFEKDSVEPSRKQIIRLTKDKFEEVTGIKVKSFNLKHYVLDFVNKIRENEKFKSICFSERNVGYMINVISEKILNAEIEMDDKLLYLYLLKNDNSFARHVTDKLNLFQTKIEEVEDSEVRIISENLLSQIVPHEFSDIMRYILRKKDIKVSEEDIHAVTRKVVLFFIDLINKTKGTQLYEKYTHTLIRVVETEFTKQNSSINEMIQHGITIHRDFEMKNKALESHQEGMLKWINELMSKCGVIASEQPVQRHTRIVTDAKKREYPFHKIDRNKSKKQGVDISSLNSAAEIIKHLDTRPDSSFFAMRLARFVANMDRDDYRCKIMRKGLVKELVVFQKSYMKYLTDNYRLFMYDDITEDDVKNFVPDVIAFFGAPEKVISFPQVGYFDLKGPNGNIKTIVTPLKQKADYFGNIKKPRLTMINEKIKEMGGIPKHGSLFAVEEEDGSLFVVEIDGDSGAGKSEMIAAMILKWLRKNIPGIRSIKLIAGDMFHVFQDSEGNLYGIGTEVGDFSRVTDFDPDYIRYYKYLFESSADSNVEDLNSRSTISGLCDVTMPYKIDIYLAANNYAKEEAGITRIDNPENFLLYIDGHGERKEKATSQDGPNLQQTLSRYTDDKNIVEVLAKHGNYLDTILDWQKNPDNGKFYLASSYKMIDKIDIEQIVNQIFVEKIFPEKDKKYRIEKVDFDIIKNQFMATVKPVDAEEKDDSTEKMALTRNIFSAIFDSLASTPAGQPFISEYGQIEQKKHLIEILKGGKEGIGKAKAIQCGILSTDLGKKGKEITGPQKAAEDMKQLIQEVRIQNPEINRKKTTVKQRINQKYSHIFHGGMENPEIWRYNFYLYQLDEMRKADFRRIDDISQKVDFSNVKNFFPKAKNEEFSPLLVTPNVNIELNAFSETYRELMSLPNYPVFADEFSEGADKLYEAKGYHRDTVINNMIIQLLLMDDYIDVDDLSRGRISEKINRETIAAAKHAVVKELKRRKKEKTAKETKETKEKKEKTDDK